MNNFITISNYKYKIIKEKFENQNKKLNEKNDSLESRPLNTSFVTSLIYFSLEVICSRYFSPGFRLTSDPVVVA